ncbi:flippase [Candidatus Woesearchaeota archaeon]|nr:flippase [Candidatus Woesearchaeota archaeon]USN44160.1 MAG: flippase [Candidatus Woesearchaeota archaeon]
MKKMKKLIGVGKDFLFKNNGPTQILFKNTFWLMFSELFNKGLMLLLTIFLARYLGSEGYGEFTFALSFTLLLVVACDFGLTTYSTREMSKKREDTNMFVNNVLLIKLVLTLITLGICLFFLSFFQGKTFFEKSLVFVMTFYVIINTFNEFFRAVFRSHERMEYEAYSKIIQAVALFSLAIFFIFFQYSALYVAFAYVFGVSLSFLFCYFIVTKKFGTIRYLPDKVFIKKILLETWPFALSSIFVSIYFSIDSLFISFFKGDSALGQYSVAYMLITALYIIPTVLTNAYFPKFSELFGKKKEREIPKFLNLFILKVTVIIIPLCIILYFLATFLIETLYSQAYSEAILPFKILLLALFFKFYSFPFGFLLSAMNQQMTRLKIQGFTSLLNIGTNLYFIPYYGIVGAAITTVISEGVLLGFYFVYAMSMLRKNGSR